MMKVLMGLVAGAGVVMAGLYVYGGLCENTNTAGTCGKHNAVSVVADATSPCCASGSRADLVAAEEPAACCKAKAAVAVAAEEPSCCKAKAAAQLVKAEKECEGACSEGKACCKAGKDGAEVLVVAPREVK
jgi:hypothetical protein